MPGTVVSFTDRLGKMVTIVLGAFVNHRTGGGS